MGNESAVKSAIAGLDAEDWLQALKQGGPQSRRRVAAVLGVAVGGHPQIRLLKDKARALPDAGNHALARALTLGAWQRGVNLLGEARANPEFVKADEASGC